MKKEKDIFDTFELDEEIIDVIEINITDFYPNLDIRHKVIFDNMKSEEDKNFKEYLKTKILTRFNSETKIQVNVPGKWLLLNNYLSELLDDLVRIHGYKIIDVIGFNNKNVDFYFNSYVLYFMKNYKKNKNKNGLLSYRDAYKKLNNILKKYR